MARTVDPERVAARREAFLDAAEGLLRSQGYERMSVADVLAATGASKGAFYHYFTAKRDLVAAVMDRMSERIAAAVSAAASGKGPPASRLQGCFSALAQWKGGRPELLGALVEVWQSEANAVVRQWLRVRISRIAAYYAKGQRVIRAYDTGALIAMAALVVLLLITGVETTSFATGLVVGMTLIQVFLHRFDQPLPQTGCRPSRCVRTSTPHMRSRPGRGSRGGRSSRSPRCRSGSSLP